MSLGVVGVCYGKLKISAASFFLFLNISSDMAELTIYGPSRGCALVQFIGDMLIEGVYSIIDTFARQGV